MKIAFFAPMAYDPETVMGVMLSIEYDDEPDPMWVPFPVPTGTLAFYETLEAPQLLAYLPDDFPVFVDLQTAGEFLMAMFTMMKMRLPDTEFTDNLVEIFGGIWSSKDMLALVELPPDPTLN